MPHVHSKFFEAYNEDGVFDEYIKKNLRQYINSDDDVALMIAGWKEDCNDDKAVAAERIELIEKIKKKRPDVINASNLGSKELWNAIRQKILHAIERGELSINRCPSCRQIVRTPSSEQCLWCGHDWHRTK
jgi:hypothetical protein